MRITVITPVFPFPPHDGDRIRINNFIKALSKNHRLSLVSFLARGEEERLGEAGKYCASIKTVPIDRPGVLLNAALSLFSGQPLNQGAYFSKQMENAVRETVAKERSERLFVYRLRMAPYAAPYAAKIPAVIDIVDSLALFMKRGVLAGGNPVRSLYYALDYPRVKNAETSLKASGFKSVLVNYEGDAEFLGGGIETVPNGVELMPAAGRNRGGIFTVGIAGDFAYAPNREGLLWFYRNVWKKYFYFDKSVRLAVAGKNSRALSGRIKGENVAVAGYVESLDAEMGSWDVLAAPVFYGAGRQNKILQAWANSLPVVAAPFALPGIKGREGLNILSAGSAEEFCEKLLLLKRDERLASELGLKGRETAAREFSWEKSAKELEKIIERGSE